MLDGEEEKFRDLHIARRQQSERRKSTTRERRKLEAEKDTRNADVKRRRTSKNFQRDQVGRGRGGERGVGGGGGSGFDSRWSLVRLFHPTSKARNFIAHKRAGGAAIISGAKFPGIDAAPGRDPNSPVPRPGSAAPCDSELSFSITVDFPCYNSLHVPTQCSSYIFKITTLFLRAALLCLFGCALPPSRAHALIPRIMSTFFIYQWFYSLLSSFCSTSSSPICRLQSGSECLFPRSSIRYISTLMLRHLERLRHEYNQNENKIKSQERIPTSQSL